MPMYDYKCSKCGYMSSAICNFVDRDKQPCAVCGSTAVARQLSAGAFVIDGKMSTSHPNSPDGMQRAKEIKKKYWKKGKKAHDEWVAENKARHARDRKWGYAE